jgi:hypothetical protein
MKNQQFMNMVIFFPLFFLRELAKFFHGLVFRQKNLKAYFSALFGAPKMLKKRFAVYKKNHLTAGEMRRIFKLR